MSCLDNVPLHACVWFEDGGSRKTSLAAITAGFLFFTGWWFMIDATFVNSDQMSGGYHVCGIVGTISLIMVNIVSNAQIEGDSYSGGCFGSRGARAWLFMGFVLGFASVIASCWILIADFLGPGSKSNTWVGVSLFIQNFLIFAASLVYKFCRVDDFVY
ncbi:unnamed protein product [Bemisia tabaci]|uniref:Transmembrane protein 50A n=1 Tax=Bemisia tabaci TaxID=7038 RepID=A0A9P0F2H3_BEMTA|nr:PREDICTED: transmembrane protein 50A [Bemisia tabaci]CAH0386118.1 unnamed protein product [Bemisia tabaci]